MMWARLICAALALSFAACCHATEVAKLTVGQRVDDFLVDLGAYVVKLPSDVVWTSTYLEDSFQVAVGGVIQQRLRNVITLVGMRDNKFVAVLQLRSFPRSVPMSQWPDEPCRADPATFSFQDTLGSRMFMPECLALTHRYEIGLFAQFPTYSGALERLKANSVELPTFVLRGFYAKYAPTNFLTLSLVVPADGGSKGLGAWADALNSWMKNASRIVPAAMASGRTIELPACDW